MKKVLTATMTQGIVDLMGYYINQTSKGDFLPAQGKDKALIAAGDAVRVPSPKQFEPGLVCVLKNGGFDAAGYAFNEKEMNEFSHPDGRSRTWLKMDDSLAQSLSGFARIHKKS